MRTVSKRPRLTCLCFLLTFIASGVGISMPTLAGNPAARLASILTPPHQDRPPWAVQVDAQLPPPARIAERVRLRIERPSAQVYRLHVTAADYALSLERTPETTRLVLGHHGVVFVGDGPAPARTGLDPRGLPARLISDESTAGPMLQMFSVIDPAMAMTMAIELAQLRPDGPDALANARGDIRLQLAEEGVVLRIASASVALRSLPAGELAAAADAVGADAADLRVVRVDRAELERLVSRALHRASEILWPGPALTRPIQAERSVPNGQLQWIEGQRIVRLWGTPEQIGRAHGTLLARQVQRSVDSTLHAVGLFHTVRTGRWFPDEIRDAWGRLKPFIPEAHQRETAAVAQAAGIDADMLQLAQVFPELFHCSGFAVYGSATVDGKLYHGRVLDYMTHIGLHHSSTVFAVKPRDAHGFVNVGYAGFIGSVTGMNDQGVSLGEMGGGGLGDWDGVPMATLMRRALEECDTLAEVIDLWRTSPRTCEYFYVWADGKTNEAVGVAATPEKLEIIPAGQTHPLLGEGVADTVMLSRDSRLAALRQRVQEQYGRIDTQAAIRLMDRPVAMVSNLHNVLFIPADGLLYIAHADDQRKAYEQPYVRLDLKQLLAGMEP